MGSQLKGSQRNWTSANKNAKDVTLISVTSDFRGKSIKKKNSVLQQVKFSMEVQL